MDKRPAIEQVKSGLRLVGAMLTAFAAVLLISIGYIAVTTPQKQHVALGWLILLLTVSAMFATAQFWVNWFCGLACLAALRCTFLPFFVHQARLSLGAAIALSASLWLMAILSVQFYRTRKLSIFGQVSITTAAVCLSCGFARLGIVGDGGMLLPILIGIPLLVFSNSKRPLMYLMHRFSS
jgi:hypothetical protein